MHSQLFAILIASSFGWFSAQEPAQPDSPSVTSTEQVQEPETPRKPTRRGLRTPEMAPNDPDAEAFLGELVKAQLAQEDLPPVSAFAMAFTLRDYPPDRGQNKLEVEVAYRQADASFRMLAHDTAFGESVSKGFDAEGYWLRTAEEKLVTLEAKEYANDREVIDMTMTFCEDFLLLFDLSLLRKRAGGLKLSEAEDHRKLTGVMRRGRRDLWKFELFVPKDSALPTALVLELPKPEKSEEPEQSTDEEGAEASAKEEQPQGPQFLRYEFGDWSEHSGRLLPAFLDEFHTRDPEGLPRRAVDVHLFRWREPDKIPTSR